MTAELEDRVQELEKRDRDTAIQCPFYPGKPGNGDEVLKRVEAIEKGVVNLKWLIAILAATNGGVLVSDWAPSLLKLVAP